MSGPRLTRVGRSVCADVRRRSRAASERVGRSAGPGSEPAPQGESGRSVGDVQCKINFAPPEGEGSGLVLPHWVKVTDLPDK